MKKQMQSGSAHVIIIITLVIVILGLLVFVLWSNYLKPKAEITQNTASSQQKSDTAVTGSTSVTNSRYESQLFTFEYPREGWSVTEEHYDVTDQSKITPVAKTTDWAQEGMAVNNGASVSINMSVATESLSEMKSSTASFSGGIAQDLKDTKVDGVDAYSYRMSYEGERYHTVFIRSGTAYDIQYQYAYKSDASTHIDGYNMIVSTFKFKSE